MIEPHLSRAAAWDLPLIVAAGNVIVFPYYAIASHPMATLKSCERN